MRRKALDGVTEIGREVAMRELSDDMLIGAYLAANCAAESMAEDLRRWRTWVRELQDEVARRELFDRGPRGQGRPGAGASSRIPRPHDVGGGSPDSPG